jgi:hypothetical protein
MVSTTLPAGEFTKHVPADKLDVFAIACSTCAQFGESAGDNTIHQGKE